MNFKQFLEIFDLNVQNAAKWVNKNGHAAFEFNLNSDPVKNCGGFPCYYVYVTNQGEISFGHNDTSDVETRKPPVLYWSASKKSRDGALNVTARAKIYDKLAARFLATDYVKQGNRWVRKDTVQPTRPVQNTNIFGDEQAFDMSHFDN